MVLLRVRYAHPSRRGEGQASRQGSAAALRGVLRRPEGAHLQAMRRAPSRPHPARRLGEALERDELSLSRLLIPFVPAEAGTQFFSRALGPGSPLPRGRTEIGSMAAQS